MVLLQCHFFNIYLLRMKANWLCLKNLAQFPALVNFVYSAPSPLMLFRDNPSKINHYSVFLDWVISVPSTMICWGWRTCLYHRAASLSRQLVTVGCEVGPSSQSVGKMSWRCLHCFLLILLSSRLFSAWLVFSSNSSILNICSDAPPRSEILTAEVKGMVELGDREKDN